MFIDIAIENYRSIKDVQTFSLKGCASRLKKRNTFEPIKDYNNLKLLKSAVLYGGNSSGKSNLIRAFWTLRNFVIDSLKLKAGDLIPDNFYDPYLLDDCSKNRPTKISINFIARNGRRHRYIIQFNKFEVIYEYLGVYETSRISRIYERKNANELVEFGKAMVNKKEDNRVCKNNLFLSKFGSIPNGQLRDLYVYFKEMEVWNIASIQSMDELYNKVQQAFNIPGNYELRRKLSALIHMADNRITEIQVAERPDEYFENLPETYKGQLKKALKFETFGFHEFFVDSKERKFVKFTFKDQESQGIRCLFAIGGLVINIFERNVPVLVVLDDFGKSLHPHLIKFILDLFHNPIVNKNNAQLIFATHETTLLDIDGFRKDQIWFSEKDKFGVTKLFSVNDLNNLKKASAVASFDNCYTAEKFAVLPNGKKNEFISEYE